MAPAGEEVYSQVKVMNVEHRTLNVQHRIQTKPVQSVFKKRKFLYNQVIRYLAGFCLQLDISIIRAIHFLMPIS